LNDEDCIRLLQWALPQLHLRWQGFRRVRRQVCRRVDRRLRELGLPDADSYRSYLQTHPAEWRELDELCRVTSSRFHRNRGVFAFLEQEVLPALAHRRDELAAWSAGCASGEEPYTLVLLWQLELAAARFPGVQLHVLATDVDEAVLRRAHEARYHASSLKELPTAWRAAFSPCGDSFELLPEYRRAVVFRRHDVRSGAPDGPFDLVFCRNLAFTYFDEELQHEVCDVLAGCLRPGGALVVGAHETLPASAGFEPWSARLGVHRRLGRSSRPDGS
jgi:chemotaxis protein methyltransferase CheR